MLKVTELINMGVGHSISQGFIKVTMYVKAKWGNLTFIKKIIISFKTFKTFKTFQAFKTHFMQLLLHVTTSSFPFYYKIVGYPRIPSLYSQGTTT